MSLLDRYRYARKVGSTTTKAIWLRAKLCRKCKKAVKVYSYAIVNPGTFVEDVNAAFKDKERQEDAKGIRKLLCADCLIIYKKALGEDTHGSH
jgi:hypothetical protein